MVMVEFAAEGFDDQVMVFALRQTGDGDAADDACSCDFEGKAAAVGGIFGVGQRIFFDKRCVVVFEVEAELIRAAVKAGHDV